MSILFNSPAGFRFMTGLRSGRTDSAFRSIRKCILESVRGPLIRSVFTASKSIWLIQSFDSRFQIDCADRLDRSDVSIDLDELAGIAVRRICLMTPCGIIWICIITARIGVFLSPTIGDAFRQHRHIGGPFDPGEFVRRLEISPARTSQEYGIITVMGKLPDIGCRIG